MCFSSSSSVGTITSIADSCLLTLRWGQGAMFSPGHIALKTRGDILPLGLKIAGPGGTPLPPGPELALRVCRTAGLTGLHGGLPVIGANLGVVAEVGRVLLITETVGRRAQVTREAV